MRLVKKALFFVLGFTLVTVGAAWSGPCCKTPAKECPAKKSCDSTKALPQEENKSPDKTILFFMNPNGRPCQMQLEVIDGMKTKLAPLALVTLIKTTESGDRDKFSRYGIRGLPSLIIIDKNGKEITRFQPGIQDEATILNALEQKVR